MRAKMVIEQGLHFGADEVGQVGTMFVIQVGFNIEVICIGEPACHRGVQIFDGDIAAAVPLTNTGPIFGVAIPANHEAGAQIPTGDHQLVVRGQVGVRDRVFVEDCQVKIMLFADGKTGELPGIGVNMPDGEHIFAGGGRSIVGIDTTVLNHTGNFFSYSQVQEFDEKGSTP